MADDLPLVLLDVDGVLNALGLPGPGDDRQWRSGSAQALGRHWPIRYAPAVVDRIVGWVADGWAEVAWLTTWGHDANDSLRLLLGMPELPVAGTHDDAEGPVWSTEAADGSAWSTEAADGSAWSTKAPDGSAWSTEAAAPQGATAPEGATGAGTALGQDSLAGATPSAPAPGGWWKADVVQGVLAEHPGRMVVWIDDGLVADSQFTQWAAERGVLTIGPDPMTGLTSGELDRVEQVLPSR